VGTILRVRDEQGNIKEITAIIGKKGDKGDKGDKGASGVYVGSGDMPEDCNVQIDPSGSSSKADDIERVLIPDYVVSEAERVAKKVYSRQNSNTFSFLVITDAHYLESNEDYRTAILHAGQGMNLVRKGVHIDFGAVLGDNGAGIFTGDTANRTTIAAGINEERQFNKCIDESLRGIPNFRVPGNHDSLVGNYTLNGNDYLDSDDLFPFFGAYNTGAAFQSGERDRGYCYRDFEDINLRVIALNTSDIKDFTKPVSTANHFYVSAVQGQWFAEALDLSAKSNASEWSILLLSHTPMDWAASCNFLCQILKAYKDGTSVSISRDGKTVSYDYSGKNSAKIIGNIHGHNHCFKVDNLRLYSGSGSKTNPIPVYRMCIPNACFGRTNERGENGTLDLWDIEYGDEISYEKTAGTAEDTAFCVVTVDLAKQMIYADCYGAGYDRELYYGA